MANFDKSVDSLKKKNHFKYNKWPPKKLKINKLWSNNQQFLYILRPKLFDRVKIS